MQDQWFYCVVPESIHTIGNSEGRGVLEAKMFKGKYEPKLEFPEGFGGGRLKQRNPQWGEYGYFLEQHIRRRQLAGFDVLMFQLLCLNFNYILQKNWPGSLGIHL